MMSRYGCAEAFRRLDDYVDRELAPDELALVAEHLEECERCASEFGLERELLDGVRDRLRRIRVPDGLMERIRQKLQGLQDE